MADQNRNPNQPNRGQPQKSQQQSNDEVEEMPPRDRGRSSRGPTSIAHDRGIGSVSWDQGSGS